MTTTMTNGGTAGLRRFSLGVSQRIALLTGAVAAAAVALFVIVVQPLSAAPTALNLPWVLWAGVFAISEVLVVHVQWKREAHTFSISDLVLAAGLVLAVPGELVLAQVAGTIGALVLHRRQYDLKLAFNAAQFALTGCLATIVYNVLATPLGDAWSWVAQLAAVAVATVTAALCIFAVMSLAEGRADVRPLLGMLGFSLPFTLGAAAVGVVVARTSVNDPAALALLMIPTLLIIAAYRAYTRAREQQENLKLLHEVTSLLHGDDVDAAMGDFLTSARTAFRASTAELVLVSSAGNGGLTVSRSQEGAEPVVMSVPEEAEEQERLLRLATAAGALATRTGSTSRGGPLDTYAAQRGFKDAMVAALPPADACPSLRRERAPCSRAGPLRCRKQPDEAPRARATRARLCLRRRRRSERTIAPLRAQAATGTRRSTIRMLLRRYWQASGCLPFRARTSGSPARPRRAT